jgi:hypothetical protein
MNKLYTDNPKVNDRVEFIFLTPDANKCYPIDPYYIENITIFFIERNYASPNIQEYDTQISQANLEARYLVLKNVACEYPSEENAQLANDAFDSWQKSIVTNPFYYANSQIVFQAGSSTQPLWVRGGTNTDSIVIKAPTDEFPYCRFQFFWDAFNVREGDYFICYKWKPNPSGDTLSAHLPFYLNSDIAAYTSNPTHRTPPKKYYDLLTRYLPEMYKSTYADTDRTPEILDKLNLALNDGFKQMEDLVNQIIDLLDANVLQEPLLIYLANFFNLKLRSSDPTRWRKQIKKAVPLNKMKGRLEGLRQALSDAGMELVEFSQLWQVGTKYSYTESFLYSSETIFKLKKVSLDKNNTFFLLQLETNTSDYATISLDNIEIYTSNGVSYMKYIGNTLELSSRLKITYQIKEFPNETQVQIHSYILGLSLIDTRDDRYFEYPPKDWNTYGIEETDPLFDVIVNVKNPFYEPIIFGKIRTEFPYSEQAYNMDEYNGSLRDSFDPKDIDKNFIEPCRDTISARYNLELSVQDLSNIRLVEAQEIIAEYTPFHAILHTLKFNGYMEDYMLPAYESWQILIKYNASDYLISGQANTIFNRNIRPNIYGQVLRNMLTTAQTVESGTTNVYNDTIILFCPLQNLETIGITSISSDTLLQILAPHANSGEYTVQNPVGNYVEVIGSISEPLNTTEFSFILSNIVLSDSNFDVYQDNLYFVTDLTLDFLYYPIKTIFDVENGQAVASWKIQIVSTGFIYEITNIINNKIYLLNDGSLTNTYYENLDYKLLDNSNNIIFESTDGIYNVVYRGRVVVDSGTGVGNIQTFLTRNNYFFFDADSSQYYIDGYPDTLNEIYIDNYNAGDQGGVSGKVLQRLAADNGNLDYNKMLFLKPITFPIFTDPNDPNALEDSTFKENYLIEINSSFYSIVSEETIGLNQYLFLSGKFDEWGTISSGGTSVSYDLIRYVKDPATIMLQDFDFVDRSGQEVITNEIMSLPAFAMTDLASGSETKDFSVQEESIGYTILTKDNKKTEGNI